MLDAQRALLSHHSFTLDFALGAWDGKDLLTIKISKVCAA
jgi:hypothetical protein